ncbi:glycerol kinase GlpK [Entomobacter blattae]|uniref:Glycerol kinase n=1 Tax=Entomobacter blattae TaxID=2762277 RepID=A0A7H1NUY6_9PROT|nr:glycerol kinase GlpK [Entomobacter blattae]QNT79596.1 Glycerol kinase [Entomobacter blattae]
MHNTRNHVLSIDQGTTSSRAIVFDDQAAEKAVFRKEFHQYYPTPGWVEHDVEEIWRDVVSVCKETIYKAGGVDRIASIGITNQRETIVVWDRITHTTVYNAIVWQDRRTAERCEAMKKEGLEPIVQQKTGLLLDPYFSASKLAWILDNVPNVRERAEKGELAAGTIDCFLLWKLTNGQVHATDITNASRTLLFNIHEEEWDDDLLRLFNIPRAILPKVHPNSHIYGETHPTLFGRSIPIAGMAGDQQSAMIGQTCFKPGMVKSTYGTGCFMLLNTGDEAVNSENRLLTTIAYQINGVRHYALEGSIFVAGAGIKWLRDGLGLITYAAQTHDMATRIPNNGGVYMVPAFVGMGAPYWMPDAKGMICGLTLDSTAAHVARAALESIAYQTYDLENQFKKEAGGNTETVRVDGGAAANEWFCQFLADILDIKVERPVQLETTALGAAFLAGLATEVWPDLAALEKTWKIGSVFEPKMKQPERNQLLAGWKDAVARTLLPHQAS